MLRFATCLTLAVLLAAPLAAQAQDDAAPDVRIDAAAKKLVDAGRAKMISNRTAGLTSLGCKVAINVPQGTFVCKTEWSAKEGTKVTLDSLPEAMEPMRAMIEPQLKSQVEQLVVNRFCDDEFALTDHCHIEMKEGSEDTVVLTGYEGEYVGRAFTIRFGENGLPAELWQQVQGMDVNLKFRYAEKDGKFLVVGWDISSAMHSQKVDWTYEKKAGMWVATKVVTSNPMGGSNTIEISEFSVNGKAVDKTETPAEKPEGCGGCGKDGGAEKDGEGGCGEGGGCGRDGGTGGGESGTGGCGGCKKDG